MKWFIASDIHGSAHYCRLLLEAFEREKCDRILLLGDILYHGPRNDLPEGYAQKEVIAMLNEKTIILSKTENLDKYKGFECIDIGSSNDLNEIIDLYAMCGAHKVLQNPRL